MKEIDERYCRETQENESSIDLKPNVAGLLAYLGLWVTGIIFLVLEQKNRFVRFHASQSIVAFGSLFFIQYMLSHIPLIGWVFNVIFGILTFVLWIVLMVRAYNSEWYRLPVAGDLAERLIGLAIPDDRGEAYSSRAGTGETKAKPSPAKSKIDDSSERFKDSRAGRIASSAFAIAWSFALLIFFNFFNDYIAYYHVQNLNGAEFVVRETVLTGAFALWLPVLTTALVFAMIGHTVIIIIDRYLLRETTLLVLDIFAIAVVATLLSIFPFDFSVIPDARIADIVLTATQVGLVIVLLAVGIGVLVRFIKLTVSLARGTSGY